MTPAESPPGVESCYLAADGRGRLWFGRGGNLGVFRDGRFHMPLTLQGWISVLARLREIHPDVILMDINLPGASGIEATRAVKRFRPDVRIVMLTVYEGGKALFDSLKAGACGYLLKRSTPEKILEQTAINHSNPANNLPFTSDPTLVSAFQNLSFYSFRRHDRVPMPFPHPLRRPRRRRRTRASCVENRRSACEGRPRVPLSSSNGPQTTGF